MKEEKTLQQIEAIEKETRSFQCPCCHAHLQFRTIIKVVGVGLSLTGEEAAIRDGREVERNPEKTEKQKLVNENQAILKTAKNCGLFDSFNKTLEIAHPHIPVDREAYFIKWLTRAMKTKTPQYSLWQCLDNEDFNPNDELELWGWQNVSAVLKNKEFKVFIPNKLVKGETIEKLEVKNNSVKLKSQMDLTTWIRTKYGYVAKSKEFSDELRKHSIGSFQL